jgi:MoxR-like ATPase
MRKVARAVPIARPIQEYAIRLVLATHPQTEFARPMVNRYVRYGASPRGAQALVIGGKIRALLDGRVHVSSEDVRAMVLPALRHRLLLNFEGEAEQIDPTTSEDVLDHGRKTVLSDFILQDYGAAPAAEDASCNRF